MLSLKMPVLAPPRYATDGSLARSAIRVPGRDPNKISISSRKSSLVYACNMAEDMKPLVGAPEKRDIKLTAENAGRLLQAACDFQAHSTQAREKCRDDFRQAEREADNTLRILVDGQMAALETTIARPISKIDPALSYQIGLVTSYVRTHFVVTELILNGDLVEAVTLIRKQLEPSAAPRNR